MELYLHSKINAHEAPPVEPPHGIDDDRNNKPLIPLRLPAALLVTLSTESRLVIHRRRRSRSNENNADAAVVRLLGEDSGGEKRAVAASADVLTLTVTPNGEADTHPDDCFPLEEEVVDPKQHTDWYQSQSTNTATDTITASDDLTATTIPKKELHRIGTTNKQYTIKPKSKTDLKEIGKRTRRLLEQERKNRKEIVRLDDDELPLPPHPSKKKTTVQKKLLPSTDATKMPPLKKTVTKASSNTTNARKRKRRGVPSNIDGWMPSINNLLPLNNTADHHHRSNIVRLHGLPQGVKPEHIRKFFDGLNPSLIFVLPSFTNRIRGWDASSSSNETANDASPVVKRHASNFRVFVKFASAPVADAAIERSGESIGFDIGESEGSTNNNTATTGTGVSRVKKKEKKKIVGASISLSPVSKHVASFLVKHMAIHTRKGESIIDTMTKTEQKLGQVVDTVWTAATGKLDLERQIIRKGDGSDTRHDLEYLNHEYRSTIPTNNSSYVKLAKVYNQLIDTHEQLELDFSLLFTHGFDPSCIEDSVHRITQSVSNWLLDEIYFVGRLLKESRPMIKF